MRLNKIKSEDLQLPENKLLERPYVATTDNVQISVWPEFLDSKLNAGNDLFIWAYHVRIDNNSAESLKLLNRYWRIIDEKGGVQEVNGEGVIGEKPLIEAGKSYQYTSGVHLNYPSGVMTGHYQMRKNDGTLFNAKIPTFSLDAPSVKKVLN